MILIVCPNLAVDVTIELDDINGLRAGEVHRARRTTRRAGGKGVNLARAANALGERTLVLGLAGGRRGEEIAARLGDDNIDAELVACGGESRTCTIALEPSGRATVLNEPGPVIEDASVLEDAFHRLLHDARVVALAGSLQPGLPATLYRDFVAAATRADKPCLVDTTGVPLREALSAHPWVAKPNRAEAATFLERQLATPDDCARAASALHAAGAELAVVSGGADGVIAASASGVAHCWSEQPSDMRFGNATGAGDALAAGIVVGHLRGFDIEEMLRLGVATATASLAEGYGRLRAKDVRVDAVRFEFLSDSAD